MLKTWWVANADYGMLRADPPDPAVQPPNPDEAPRRPRDRDAQRRAMFDPRLMPGRPENSFQVTVSAFNTEQEAMDYMTEHLRAHPGVKLMLFEALHLMETVPGPVLKKHWDANMQLVAE